MSKDEEHLSDPNELAVSMGPVKQTLEKVQCYLNACGLTSLLVNLIMNSPPYMVFLETVNLSVALLNEGNMEVQVSC